MCATMCLRERERDVQASAYAIHVSVSLSLCVANTRHSPSHGGLDGKASDAYTLFRKETHSTARDMHDTQTANTLSLTLSLSLHMRAF